MSKKTTLADLITQPTLEKLAGDRSFARGVDYFRSESVERLVSRNGRISARVAGTDLYTVKLWPEGRQLDWSCTCPMGEQGEFCKHAVATGLAWLARGDGVGDQMPDEFDVIRAYLEASDKQALVKMLLERAIDDDDLAAGLLLAAQRQGVSAPAAVKETIRRAFAVRDFVGYHEMPSLAAAARSIPDMLLETLRQGDAHAVIELSADAMKRGLGFLENSDDSDGMLGNVLSNIAAIHRQACRKDGLAPAQLAQDLLDLQLADGFGFFSLKDYQPALGKEGLAAYRKFAEAAWKKLPPRAPGSREDDSRSHRYQLTEIMKTLARLDNDTDALVDVLRRDLTQPYTYLQIAETLSKAKRHDEALQWAEDGRKASKNQLSISLDDFLVAEYHRRKRHDDAIALRWSFFESHPGLDGYQKLKAAASKTKSWQTWREKALALLRQPKSARPRTRDVFSYVDSKASVLIQISLWEGDPRAALAEARASGCPGHLWLHIAKALEADSPTDAIAIYRDQIEPIVRLTNNQAYDNATDLLRRIRDLMAGIGKGADFAPYLDTLRAQYKAKRNFMQRLDGVAAEKAAKRVTRRPSE